MPSTARAIVVCFRGLSAAFLSLEPLDFDPPDPEPLSLPPEGATIAKPGPAAGFAVAAIDATADPVGEPLFRLERFDFEEPSILPRELCFLPLLPDSFSVTTPPEGAAGLLSSGVGVPLLGGGVLPEPEGVPESPPLPAPPSVPGFEGGVEGLPPPDPEPDPPPDPPGGGVPLPDPDPGP